MLATLFACVGSAYAPTDAERTAAVENASMAFATVLSENGYPTLSIQLDNEAPCESVGKYMYQTFAQVKDAAKFSYIAARACNAASSAVSGYPDYHSKCITERDRWTEQANQCDEPGAQSMWEFLRPILGAGDPVAAIKSTCENLTGVTTLKAVANLGEQFKNRNK